VKRRRGNPNMRVGGPSVNPGGRPKSYPELRALCQEKTIAGVERMYEILNDPQQPGSQELPRGSRSGTLDLIALHSESHSTITLTILPASCPRMLMCIAWPICTPS